MNNAPTPDQRNFSRIPFQANVILKNEGNIWESRLLDLSLKGALVTQPEHWHGRAGDSFTLELALGQDAIIRMDVTVAHSENERVGFHCEHIDVDSITHLRRLVELNLGDSRLLDRELSHLGAS